MIRLLFVGDGPRDGVMVPELVSILIGQPIEATTRPWARLNRAGRGYDRKLLYAIAQARDDASVGVVATVDADKDGKNRIKQLRDGRELDRRRNAAFPIALGCAEPHGEAWLLDDPTAVRKALDLPAAYILPTVRIASSPKDVLDEAMAVHGRGLRPLHLIGEIAKLLDRTRCVHKAETGFRAFENEVEGELSGIGP